MTSKILCRNFSLGEKGVRYVMPHAPYRSITINGGTEMRAWYDVHGIDIEAKVDVKGFEEAVENVHRLIQKEKRKRHCHRTNHTWRIFSGGICSLTCGLAVPSETRSHCRSIHLPIFMESFQAMSTEAFCHKVQQNLTTPLFLAHGKMDPIVAYSLGEKSMQFLKERKCRPIWKVYNMYHEVCYEEIRDLSLWLSDVIKEMDAEDTT